MTYGPPQQPGGYPPQPPPGAGYHPTGTAPPATPPGAQYGGPAPTPAPQIPAPRAPPSGAPKRSKLPVVIIVLGLLSVIMMGVSLALPWYYMNYNVSGGGTDIEMNVDMTFEGMDAEGMGEEDFTSWDDTEDMDNTKSLYATTQMLVVVGIIGGVLLMVGGIMLMNDKKKIIAIILGLLAFILCMLGPILFMAQHPGAVDADSEGGEEDGNGPWDSFSGSDSESGGGVSMELTWGPGTGWTLGLMGFIFALIGFIMCLVVKQPKAGPAPQTAPPPGALAPLAPQPLAAPVQGQDPYGQQQYGQQQYGPQQYGQQQYGQQPPPQY